MIEDAVNVIDSLAESVGYETFIKAFLVWEMALDPKDTEFIDKLYNEFMDNDLMTLLSTELIEMVVDKRNVR